MIAQCDTTSAFEQQRRLLFAIAYRMLGSADEAEDAVQDAYLRFRAVEHVDNPRAFLTTTISRLCLDRLKSARARREQYIGEWLPEPVLTESDDPCCIPGKSLELAESVSTAFLLLLESLSPLERAVFLLHEVFDYGYEEVAVMVGQSEAACRQHVHRAKTRLRGERHRFHADPDDATRIAESFLRAMQTGDVQDVLTLIAPNVVVITDGGGKAAAALNPIVGRERALRFMQGLGRKFAGNELRVEAARVNHMPALLFFIDGKLDTAMTMTLENGVVTAVHGVRNPEKLGPIIAALQR